MLHRLVPRIIEQLVNHLQLSYISLIPKINASMCPSRLTLYLITKALISKSHTHKLINIIEGSILNSLCIFNSNIFTLLLLECCKVFCNCTTIHFTIKDRYLLTRDRFHCPTWILHFRWFLFIFGKNIMHLITNKITRVQLSLSISMTKCILLWSNIPFFCIISMR